MSKILTISTATADALHYQRASLWLHRAMSHYHECSHWKDSSSNVDVARPPRYPPSPRPITRHGRAMNNTGAAMKDDGSKKAPEGQPVKPGPTTAKSRPTGRPYHHGSPGLVRSMATGDRG